MWCALIRIACFFPPQNPDNPSPDTSFVAMAAMHSEILLVSSGGRQLYSWACGGDPTPKPHPLRQELGLEGERIALMEASDIRATVVTETGKIATFYDALLRGKMSEGCSSAYDKEFKSVGTLCPGIT